MSNASRALAWTVELLRDLEVPFQVVGGLAARAYGATRPLVDLDFYVPDDRLDEVAEAARDRLVRPPRRHRDTEWDIRFLALEHDGCRIELGGADEARYYDEQRRRWVDVDVDFDNPTRGVVLGVSVPLMPRDRLIAYKRALGRPVDRADLSEISSPGDD